jgi:hypothetical protein
MSEPKIVPVLNGLHMVAAPAGEVCVDGVCGPLTAPDDRQQGQLEYLDRQLGTTRSEPADAGRQGPSSGG